MLLLTQVIVRDWLDQEASGHFTSFYHQNIEVQTFQHIQELLAAAAASKVS